MVRITEIGPYEDSLGNKIVGSPKLIGPSAHVDFRGKNCSLVISDGVVLQAGITFLQDDGIVTIGDATVLRGGLQLGAGGKILIGKRLDVTGNLTVTVDDGVAVTIGDDCLFAANVQIRAYDNHPIFDMRTRLRTNYSRPINIGDGVWMGYDSVAMGGAVIGSGSIVGLRTVVTAATPIPPHCLAVGQPARIAKRYVTFLKRGNPPASFLPDDIELPDLSELPYFESEPLGRKKGSLPGLSERFRHLIDRLAVRLRFDR